MEFHEFRSKKKLFSSIWELNWMPGVEGNGCGKIEAHQWGTGCNAQHVLLKWFRSNEFKTGIKWTIKCAGRLAQYLFISYVSCLNQSHSAIYIECKTIAAIISQRRTKTSTMKWANLLSSPFCNCFYGTTAKLPHYPRIDNKHNLYEYIYAVTFLMRIELLELSSLLCLV